MRDWFPHDYYARLDLGIMRLLMRHGSSGYGVFWLVTELLHANDDVRRDDVIDVVRHTFSDLDLTEVVDIVDEMIRTGLLKVDMLSETDDLSPVLYSDRVRRNKEAREAITESKRAAASARWSGRRPSAEQQQSRRNADAMLLQDMTSHNTTSTDISIEAADPTLISLECTGDKLFHVKQSFIDQIRELYPGVDIMTELRKMKAWLITNRTKRKTQRGLPRFINTWLSKAQDDGKYTGHHTGPQTDRKIGERGSRYSTIDYDEQIRSIARQAIDGADIAAHPVSAANGKTSEEDRARYGEDRILHLPSS